MTHSEGSLLDYDGVYLAEGTWPAKRTSTHASGTQTRRGLVPRLLLTLPNVREPRPGPARMLDDGHGGSPRFSEAPSPDQVMPEVAFPNIAAIGTAARLAAPPTSNSTNNFEPSFKQRTAHHPLSGGLTQLVQSVP